MKVLPVPTGPMIRALAAVSMNRRENVSVSEIKASDWLWVHRS
jgi:hypothetical protein